MRDSRLVALEHSRAAYRADFVVYAIAVVALTAFLLAACPRGLWMGSAILTLTGLGSWTLVEYVVHRFVLHRVKPFTTWHSAHHRRPTALIFAPTLLSATLIVTLLFLPVLLLSDLWHASAVTLGLLAGYLGYAITHHAIHHWHGTSAWLQRRKRWHAMHHSLTASPDRFGVTTEVWDHLFRSAGHSGERVLRRNAIDPL